MCKLRFIGIWESPKLSPSNVQIMQPITIYPVKQIGKHEINLEM